MENIRKTGEQVDTKKKNPMMVEYAVLVGKRVKYVRALHPDECDALGWEHDRSDAAVVIVFDDGTIAVPTQDPELNGAGFLFVQRGGGQ